MNKSLDITGKTFGHLVAISPAPPVRGKQRQWVCECTCGNKPIVYQSNLVRGTSQSCGCMRFKHNLSYAPEYRHWINMISRCEYEKFKGWKNYGGRGIKVATAWRDSFEKFYADVGPRPTPKHSLDRIDVNGDYTPGNVRWADGKTQCRNTRVNKLVQFRGQKVPLITAVETLGLKYNTVLYRLRRGKSVEEALR